MGLIGGAQMQPSPVEKRRIREGGFDGVILVGKSEKSGT